MEKWVGDYLMAYAVEVDPLDVPGYDKIKGKRFADPVAVGFRGVKIRTGQKKQFPEKR